MLIAPFAISLAGGGQTAASGKMLLSIHQNTSRAAGYRKSLEGWARAGIKYVELTDTMLDDFLKTDNIAAAKKVVTDLGAKAALSRQRTLDEFFDPQGIRLQVTFPGQTYSSTPIKK